MKKWRPNRKNEESVNYFMPISLNTMAGGTSIPYIIIDNPEHQYEGDGAVFLVGGKRLLLRFRWGIWYLLTTCTDYDMIEITRQHNVIMHIYANGKRNDHLLPIHEIDNLPDRLFMPEELSKLNGGSTEETAVASKPRKSRAGSKGKNDSTMFLPVITKWLIPWEPTLNKTVDGKICSFFVCVANNKVLVFSFCHLNGEWLADETSYAGEAPVWFSEATHMASPVFITADFVATIKRLTGMDPVVSLIIGNEMQIINTEENMPKWNDIPILTFSDTQPHGIMNGNEFLSTLSDSLRTKSDTPPVDSLDLEAALLTYADMKSIN